MPALLRLSLSDRPWQFTVWEAAVCSSFTIQVLSAIANKPGLPVKKDRMPDLAEASCPANTGDSSMYPFSKALEGALLNNSCIDTMHLILDPEGPSTS